MVQRFDISGKGLKFNTAEDVDHYLKDLRAMHDVEEINISGNSFGIGASIALAEALTGKTELKHCNFSDIFTGRLVSEIPDSLSALGNALIQLKVQVLNLSDNAFGPNGTVPLVPYLQSTTYLQELILNNNGLGTHGGRLIAQALIDQPHPILRVFVAGRNRLENDSMPMLATAFTKHAMERIEMPQNGIRMDGIKTLMRGLTHCSKLQVLNLQDNTLTHVGALALAQCIPSWPTLTYLHLGDCLLGSRGGRVLARALIRHQPKLTHLCLGYNEMNESVLNLVTSYVQASGHKLQGLELNGNRFSEVSDAVLSLQQALQSLGLNEVLDALDELDEPGSSDEDQSSGSDDDEEEDNKDSDSELVDGFVKVKLNPSRKTTSPLDQPQSTTIESTSLTQQLENLHI